MGAERRYWTSVEEVDGEQKGDREKEGGSGENRSSVEHSMTTDSFSGKKEREKKRVLVGNAHLYVLSSRHSTYAVSSCRSSLQCID